MTSKTFGYNMARGARGRRGRRLRGHALCGEDAPILPGHQEQSTIDAMKLLIFAGSTRLHSLNRKLAAASASLARETGAEVTHIELASFDVPMYNADLESGGTPADVIRLKQLLFDHPAWIICSPEYNGSYTALLKNTLDWASSPVKGHPEWSSGTKPFQGKVVGLLSASPGALGGLRSLGHLVPLLINLECWVAPRSYALGQAGQAFDAQGRLTGETQRKSVQRVIAQTLWAAERLQLQPGC
jgi:NAD(P)H-dependent FMN reductase